MKAKSIAGKSAGEIQDALTQCMADGFRPTLAMVFLSIKQDIEALCEVLERHRIAIYGTTTNGEFTEAGMFSNGELARATNGSLEMHNLTACCVVLKER